MTDDELLAELRTIRTLLALDKEEQLNEYIGDMSDIQELILEEFTDTSWSSIPTSEIAEEFDVSDKTVQNHIGDMIESGLLERHGQGAGTEYRETGLLRAAELVSQD